MRRLAALAFLLWAGAAAAHLTPNSEVRIDFGARDAVADIVIPQGEYAFATGNPTDGAPRSLAIARRYLASHVGVRAADGRPWRLTIAHLGFERIAGPPDLHAVVRLTPPPGDEARRLVIEWRAVIDAVPSHFALFVANSDFSAGRLGEDCHVLGALQGARRTLTVDRGAASLSAGFGAAMRLGMRHIAEGHDHLLFLIALLLPAPLLAVGGRWRGRRAGRATLGKLAAIVTAFSVGHSVTLIGAAAFGWALPARPVECGIALSILVSAIHAWRPLFAGREAAVAGGFGLVHGLAFATTVSHYGLGAVEKGLTIAGFNLGIELAQLGIVAVTAPSLLLLARTGWHPGFRRAGAGFAGVAALAWLAERVAGEANPLAAAIDAGLSHGALLIGGLFLLALAATAASRVTAGAAATPRAA